jgi:hypothetical protein
MSTDRANAAGSELGSGERLKLDIYYRRNGRLVNLYRINRTPTGLYLNAAKHPLAASGSARKGDSSLSYHEDGRWWIKHDGRRDPKRLETPLSAFRDARTISTTWCTILDASSNPLESEIQVRPQDIIIDRPDRFGVEIILCDRAIVLPDEPTRPNSTTYTFNQISPVILVEVFDFKQVSVPRFTRAEPLVEGVNLFFDHPGRI